MSLVQDYPGMARPVDTGSLVSSGYGSSSTTDAWNLERVVPLTKEIVFMGSYGSTSPTESTRRHMDGTTQVHLFLHHELMHRVSDSAWAFNCLTRSCASKGREGRGLSIRK